METETPKPTPILEIAWLRHADLDLAADKRTRGFYSIRRWIAWLGVLATLFAIFTEREMFSPISPTLQVGVNLLFVAIPVVASIFAAFATKFFSNGDWLVYRAGAEEIK